MSRDQTAPSPGRGAFTSHNLTASSTPSSVSGEDLTQLLAESDPEKVLQLIEALPDTLAETFLEELGVPEAEWKAPDSPALMGQYLDSSFVIRPHIAHLSKVLTRALRDVEAGHSRRLVIEMPPRSGKTYLATIIVAAWILAKHPDWPIMLTSHDGSLAVSWGRVIRRWAASGKLGPNAMLVGDSSAASEWETKAGGVVLSRSVRESLTGRGAKCVAADALIHCEYGEISAQEAFARGARSILAHDHRTGRTEFRRVVAAQRKPGDRLLEIETQSGRTLRVTSDHLIYTSEGYRPARSLRRGDALVALAATDGVPLRRSSRAGSGRDSQSHKARAKYLLQPLVLSTIQSARSGYKKMPMWESNRSDAKRGDVLLPRVQKNLSADSNSTRHHLLNLRKKVSPRFILDSVLLSGVRESRTLNKNDGLSKPPFQERKVLFSLVPSDAPAYFRARRKEVRDLPEDAGGHISSTGKDSNAALPEYSSYRRGHTKQSARESSNSLPTLPYGASQIESDTVSVVRRVRKKAEFVYDFQVEGAHNFFTDQILVHNCLLIDDPHKDFVEAHSETVRNMVWNWWLSVAQTRLEPPSLTIITMTRWHADDLVGRILSDQYPGDPDAVEVVRLPALAEEDDALGRVVGEPLLSPLLKETPAQALVRWSEVEKSVGPYTWSAMFQQSPMPPEGMIFNPDTWRYWTTDPKQVTPDGKIILLPAYAALSLGTWLDSWDLTFTASATSDYVVGQRWVKVDSTRYLIAQKRGKWDFSAQIDQMREWLKTDDDALSPLGHLVHTRLIEKAANGAAMISQLQPKVAGLKPITPRGPKEMRARAIEPEFYSGHVRFPHPAMPGYEWVGDLLTELQTFPNGKNDDQVDALSQALLELRDPTDGESSVSIPDGMISRAYRGDTPFLPSATSDFSLSQIYGGSPLSSTQSRGVGRPRLDTTTRRI